MIDNFVVIAELEIFPQVVAGEDECTPPLAGITMMLPQSGQRPFFPPLSSGVRRVFPHSEQVNSMDTLLTPGRLSAISNKYGVLVGAFTIGRH